MTDKPTSGSASDSRKSNFEANQPSVLALLYLGGSLTFGVSAIAGLVMAYLWRKEPRAEWEVSHYTYMIRTFWMSVLWTVVGIALSVVVVGIVLLIATSVLVIVRSVKSLLLAQKHEPMPSPKTWLV
ncbi:DUF4870 family protein [Novosphingobium sp. 9]|uniref:DUF4870 family protein n=1 Tax=Novosphingobium sp. 9 TaxID=2025349 RepID=UPI0021B4F1EA|nr:hypothetical protein [Novosphingobium sp. 9]